jgi:hypothetical protein
VADPFKVDKPDRDREPQPQPQPGPMPTPGVPPFQLPFPIPTPRPVPLPTLPPLPSPGPLPPLPLPFPPPDLAPIDYLSPAFPETDYQPRTDADRYKDDAKKKRKKRKPRTVCYRGTYKETQSGTNKHRLEQIACSTGLNVKGEGLNFAKRKAKGLVARFIPKH